MSFAMPELSMQESPVWGIIDPFEQEDAVKTIAMMGGQVTRCYVFSIKTKGKNITHIKGLREYDEECFRAFDNLLMLCNKYGVRLIVPFIDTWSWWGGIEEFCAFRNKDKSLFWTDHELKEDFKHFISYVLNRVNTITGDAYKDDPAILAWETGNELRQSTYAWTKEMADHIKSIDRNHLLIDGRDQDHFSQSIEDPNIDIITAHYYGQDFVMRFRSDYERVKGKKPFFIGEFGLVPFEEIEALVDEIVASGAAGGLIWSLREHDAEGGFLWHNEGGSPYYTYHWPGFKEDAAYDEPAVVSLIWNAAYRIQGKALPSLPAPDSAPLLLPIENVSDIRFQGVVGASGYDIERREGEAGEWEMFAENVSDSDFDPDLIAKRWMLDENTGETIQADYHIVFQDHTAEKGKTYYYRVRARNSSGVSDFSNEEKILNEKPRYGIIKDQLNDFKLIFEHSPNLAFDTTDESTYAGDNSRLTRKVLKGSDTGEAFLQYRTFSDMSALHVELFSPDEKVNLQFSVSVIGEKYHSLDIKRYVEKIDTGGLYKITYFTQKMPAVTRFVKIKFGVSLVGLDKT